MPILAPLRSDRLARRFDTCYIRVAPSHHSLTRRASSVSSARKLEFQDTILTPSAAATKPILAPL